MAYVLGLDSTDKVAERLAGTTASQLLQWNGSSWDFLGGAVGTPLTDLFTGGLTVVGAKDLLWNTDGGGDIGASGATRPDNVYVKTAVTIAGATAMKSGDSAAGGDLGGTYPTSVTVNNDSHDHTSTTLTLAASDLSDTNIATPSAGHVLIWDGSDSWDNKPLSGAVTVDAAGATAVANDSHSHTSSTLTLGAITTLSDVNSGMSPNEDDVLTWNVAGGYWQAEPVPAGGSTLAGLTDTDISSPAQWQTIQWDGTDSWDNLYPGVVNQAGTQTITVLPSGSTPAEINTALAAYDIVYLKEGTYNCGTTSILVGAGKQLIGLGNRSGTTNRAVLSFSGSPGTRHISLGYSAIENVYISLTGVAHTTNIIEGNPVTAKQNFVKDVHIAAATASSVYGIYGSFSKVENVYTSGVEGINVTAVPSTTYSPIFANFYIYNAPTYGIRLEQTVSRCRFENGFIDGTASSTTDYGVYQVLSAAGTYENQFRNITVSMPNVNGFHFVGTSSYDLDRYVFDSCYVYGRTAYSDTGFHIDYCDDAKINNCHVHTCNGTANAAYGGFVVNRSERVQISGCSSTDCDNTGNSGIYADGNSHDMIVTNFISNSDYYTIFANGASRGQQFTGIYSYDSANVSGYFNGGDYVTLSDFYSYSAGSNGVYFNACLQSQVNNVYAYDPTSIGFHSNASHYSTYSNIGSRSATSYGMYFQNTQYSTITGLSAIAQGNHGVYVNGCHHSAFSAMTVSDSRASSSVYNFNFNGNQYATFNGVNSYNAQGHGIYISGNSYCNFSNLLSNTDDVSGIYCTTNNSCNGSAWTSYASGSVGIRFYSSNHYCQFSSLLVRDSTSYGVQIYGSVMLSLTGVHCYSCSSYGLYVQASGACQRCYIQNYNGYNNTTYDAWLGDQATQGSAFHCTQMTNYSVSAWWNHQVHRTP